MYHDVWKLSEIQISVSVHKVGLKQPRSSTCHHPWLPQATTTELMTTVTETAQVAKPKISTIRPSPETAYQLCSQVLNVPTWAWPRENLARRICFPLHVSVPTPPLPWDTVTVAEVTKSRKTTYIGSVIHSQGLQGPGEPKANEDVKNIAPDGVGHGHVPHACEDKRLLEWGRWSLGGALAPNDSLEPLVWQPETHVPGSLPGHPSL